MPGGKRQQNFGSHVKLVVELIEMTYLIPILVAVSSLAVILTIFFEDLVLTITACFTFPSGPCGPVQTPDAYKAARP